MEAGAEGTRPPEGTPPEEGAAGQLPAAEPEPELEVESSSSQASALVDEPPMIGLQTKGAWHVSRAP